VNYDQFVAAVRERGEYADRNEAEEVATWVLEVLARRCGARRPATSAHSCPPPLAEAVQRRGDQPAEAFDGGHCAAPGPWGCLDDARALTGSSEVGGACDVSAVPDIRLDSGQLKPRNG
jgi:Uncharacterized conserved protein (DUF2267)